MEFELMLKWAAGALVTLGITIPLSIKISPSIKQIFSKVKIGEVRTQNIPITVETGASPNIAVAGRDAIAVKEMHIHQGDDNSGRRREALRVLKKANDGIIWAIGQSKNPLNRNRPDAYFTKLRDAFETNFAHFTKADLEFLEPIVGRIVDYRKTFSELEIPCAELNKVIDFLK